VTFSTPALETALSQFKALCSGHEQLFQYGQFYVTNRTIDDLLATIETELRANLRFQFLPPDQLNNAITFFKTALRSPVTEINVSRITAMLDVIEVGGDLASIRALFAPNAADAAEAQRRYTAVWSTDDVGGGPLFFGAARLGIAQAAYQIEKVKCFDVLRAFARKLVKKRGFGGLPAAAKYAEGALAGAAVSGPPAGNAADVPQQTIKYGAPAALASAQTRMKAAIDAGGYVQCGLLSGVSHDMSVFPNPEHYVMAFAHDTVAGQNAFLFWDPDAARSNIASTSWGRGFGVLFGSGTRLSTAADDADLTAIDRTRASATFGDHVNETRRHCYQVYYLQTLPL
jgi:hypothetical protein